MLRFQAFCGWVCNCKYLDRCDNLGAAFAEDLEIAIASWTKNGFNVDFHVGFVVSSSQRLYEIQSNV